MIWNFAYTPTIWLSITSILGLAIYCLQLPSVPTALPHAICLFFIVTWTFRSSLEFAVLNHFFNKNAMPLRLSWLAGSSFSY